MSEKTCPAGRRRACAALIAAALAPLAALAQGPASPITLVVPFPAGDGRTLAGGGTGPAHGRRHLRGR